MTARPVRPANRYWTWAFITAVTVLIWVWAAGQTRDQQSMYARVRFVAPNPAEWMIEPIERAVTLKVEGSALSMQSLSKLVKEPIELTIKAEAGDQHYDLAEVLAAQSAVTGTGVNVTSVEPPVLDISVDRVEQVQVPIRIVNLTGVQTDGDVKVEPPDATIDIPSKLRKREPTLSVNAYLPEGLNLEPGPKSTAVRLQLPDSLRNGKAAIVLPSDRTAQVSFTVRSLTDSTRLSQVNVQIAGPPKDHQEYVIEVLDDVLKQITIWGDHDLIRRIEKDEVKVFAMVHLTSEDKDRRIDSKAASFVAVTPEGSIISLRGEVEGTTGPPIIHLRITPRAGAPPAS